MARVTKQAGVRREELLDTALDLVAETSASTPCQWSR